MSGPKISVYSLRGRAGEILRGQIRCEQQAVLCAGQAKGLLRELLTFCDSLDRDIANAQLLDRRTDEEAGLAKQLQQLQGSIRVEACALQAELLCRMPRISSDHKITEEAYAEKIAELTRLQTIKAKTDRLKGKMDDAMTKSSRMVIQIKQSIIHDLGFPAPADEQDRRDLTRDKDRDTRRIQESIVDDLCNVYSFETYDSTPETTVADRKAALDGTLRTMLHDRELSDELKDEIRWAAVSLSQITVMSYLQTFETVTMKGILGKAEECRRARRDFDAAVMEYASLCNAARMVPKAFPYSRQATDAINQAIEEVSRILAGQREQAYISECVDEVMSDMGYDLIGAREAVKKSGKRFRNELYTFSEGTAVNVTFASDGQITMELGGLARKDRIPTAEEMGVLKQDMTTFCGEHAEFERRLREKGIFVGERIAFLPPSEEYATIINVNDYDIVDDSGIKEIAMQTQHRKKMEKKSMRRDD